MQRRKLHPLRRFFALCLSAVLLLQTTPQSRASASETASHTLYAGPSEFTDAIGIFHDNDTVTWIETINKSWARIRLADGTAGYCSTSILSIPSTKSESADSVTKTVSATNVYASASKNADVLAVLPANARISVLGTPEDNFTLIQLPNGKLGYIPGDAVSTHAESPVTVRTQPQLMAHTGIKTEAEAAAKLEELSAYFQNGRYWNCIDTGVAQGPENLFTITDSPCKHESYGYGYCNIYTNGMAELLDYGIGMQCLGYVSLLSDLVFGTEAPITIHGNFDDIRVGDHVRLVLWDHSMVVTEVCKDENGKTYIYVTEVNADYETCRIDWGRKFTQEDLRRLGDYIEVYTRYPVEE